MAAVSIVSRIIVPFAMICLGLVFSQRARPERNEETRSSYPKVQSDTGEQLRFSAPPARVISLAPSNTEIVYALGVEDRLVAVTDWCNYPPAAREKPSVGGMVDFNLERIIEWKPDLVLAVRGNPKERLERLENVGIRVYAFESRRLSDIFSAVQRISVVLGVPEKGDTLVESLRRRVEAVKVAVRAAPRLRVYMGTLEAPYTAAGPGDFLGEVIELAGGENIVRASGMAWPVLSAEQILVADPQVVILCFATNDLDRSKVLESFQSCALWSRTSAGQSGYLVMPDQDALMRPGLRVVDALEAIARALHPECFRAEVGKP